MKLKQESNIILIVMENNEDLIQNLKVLRDHLTAPFYTVVTALGMLKNVKTGYWNGNEYMIHEQKAPAELLGISGVITPDTDPFFHFHIILGKEDGSVTGGHLIEAKIANTLEMVLLSGNIKVQRVQNGLLKKLDIIKEDQL